MSLRLEFNIEALGHNCLLEGIGAVKTTGRENRIILKKRRLATKQILDVIQKYGLDKLSGWTEKTYGYKLKVVPKGRDEVLRIIPPGVEEEEKAA